MERVPKISWENKERPCNISGREGERKPPPHPQAVLIEGRECNTEIIGPTRNQSVKLEYTDEALTESFSSQFTEKDSEIGEPRGW